MKALEPVTIGIINYNGGETVIRSIEAAKALDYGNITGMIVADNGSDDGSPEKIAKKFPKVLLLRFDKNCGSAYARNKLIEKAPANLILMLDNDIRATPGCLRKLIEIKREIPAAGAVHPEIKDEESPGIPQPYNGGWIHYLCAFIPRKKLKVRKKYEIFDTISGGALLIDKGIAGKIGNFDEDYFFNWEDGDFTFRLTLAGYPCVNVPGAAVYHKSKPRGKSKVFYQVRNRWYFIFKLYSLRTIFICLPAFIIYELSLAGLMIFKGAFPGYLKGSIHALIDAPDTLSKRKKFQPLKVKKDRAVLRAGDIYVPESMLGRKSLEKIKQLFSEIFRLYWEGAKRLL